jgi:hypothetical protein
MEQFIHKNNQVSVDEAGLLILVVIMIALSTLGHV